MPKGNPFNVECPHCGSYNVHFFTMYITGSDVILAAIVTVGLSLFVTVPVYIACKIATKNPNKKYTCDNCGYEWHVRS